MFSWLVVFNVPSTARSFEHIQNVILACGFPPIFRLMTDGRGKKILKFSLVPRASTSKLVLLPNNLSLSRKNKLTLNFLLARWTLGEKICLSCLKFNLSRAPGQGVIAQRHRVTNVSYTGVSYTAKLQHFVYKLCNIESLYSICALNI